MDEIVYLTDKGHLTVGDMIRGKNKPKDNATSVSYDQSLKSVVKEADFEMKTIMSELKRTQFECGEMKDLPAIFPPMLRPKRVPAYVRDMETGAEPEWIDITNKNRVKIGRYTTNPRIFEASRQVLTMVKSMITTAELREKNRDHVMLLRSMFKELEEMAKSHYLGNASRRGQLGRLLKVKEQSVYTTRHQVDARKMFQTSKELFETIHTWMPISRGDWTLPETWDDFEMDRQEAESMGMVVPRLNLTAEAGPPFKTSVKRVNTIQSDIANYPAVIDPNVPKAWFEYCHMKPKAEVYRSEDAYTKVRNLFVFNSCTAMPSLAFTQMMNKQIEMNMHCLIGFSIARGFGNKLHEWMNRKEAGIMVFSDNLFMFKKVGPRLIRFRSLDGVKMEAVHIQTEYMRLLTKYGTKYCMKPAVCKDVKHHLTEEAPHMFINSIALWDTIWFRVPGLGTGCPMTLLMNHMMMSICASLLDKAGPDAIDLEDDKINKILLQTGVKLETTIDTTIDSSTSKIQEIDFLGYDLTKLDGEFILVLNRKRIIKAVLFDKSELAQKDRSEAEKHLLAILKGYCKSLVLYIMGGWAHEDLAELLQKSADVSIGRLKNLTTSVSEDNISEILDSLNLDQTSEVLEFVRNAIRDPRQLDLDMVKRVMIRPKEAGNTSTAQQVVRVENTGRTVEDREEPIGSLKRKREQNTDISSLFDISIPISELKQRIFGTAKRQKK